MIGAGAIAAALQGLAGSGGGSFATIAYVQSDVATDDSSGASLNSPALEVTAGNLLVASVSWMYDAGSVSISDTAGNTWHPLTNRTTPSNNDANNQLFYSYNVAGHASNVVTATWEAGRSYRSIAVAEYSGIETASDPLVMEAGHATGLAEAKSASVTLSGTGITGLVVAALSSYNSVTASYWSGGVTNRESSVGLYAHLADIVGAAVGTHTPSFDATTTQPVLSVALFKAKQL